MDKIKLRIDGKECIGQAGETILDVALRGGIGRDFESTKSEYNR